MARENRRRRWAILVAAAAVAAGCLLVHLWGESRVDSPLFRWEDQYFGLPWTGGRIDPEDTDQVSSYAACKGRFLGVIQREGSQPLPEKNGEAFRIAAGTKVYTIDWELAQEKELSFCGLLLETEAGGVYFAYPFTLGGEEGAEITERVYAAFYPDALDDS